MALPTRIKLGYKSLPVTDSLAYYKKSQLGAVKSFITLDPERHFISFLLTNGPIKIQVSVPGRLYQSSLMSEGK